MDQEYIFLFIKNQLFNIVLYYVVVIDCVDCAQGDLGGGVKSAAHFPYLGIEKAIKFAKFITRALALYT